MIHSKISAQLHAIKVSIQILSEEFDIINTKCYQKLQDAIASTSSPSLFDWEVFLAYGHSKANFLDCICQNTDFVAIRALVKMSENIRLKFLHEFQKSFEHCQELISCILALVNLPRLSDLISKDLDSHQIYSLPSAISRIRTHFEECQTSFSSFTSFLMEYLSAVKEDRDFNLVSLETVEKWADFSKYV
jgi:hypothetical protein